MTPIDDELRAALQGRASALTPSPDPLAGIERRAQRIRRTRIGAAVAASALAVSAIAVAVPVLQDATSSGPDVPPFATAPASPTPAAASPFALNPLDPWMYRGADLDLLGPGTLKTIETDLGVNYGAASVELTPLFGQVWEPSGKFELFFLADVEMRDGVSQYFWGISETPNDAGPEFLLVEQLDEPAMALAAALPGDEGGRLLAVADPGVGGINYSPDGTPEAVSAMQELFPGVATVFIGAGSATDLLSVVDPSGQEIHRSAVPAVIASEQPSGEPVSVLDP
ncbi:MAG: hypothetical protein EPN99_01025, partial [Frankiales bacterium]